MEGEFLLERGFLVRIILINDKDLQDNDHEGMSEEEVLELEKTLVPIQLMLAKISLIDYCCCDSA